MANRAHRSPCGSYRLRKGEHRQRKNGSGGAEQVVLKVIGEPPLFELTVNAENAGISTGLVQDAGLTEVPPGTVTALGLGPAKSEILDKITGNLPLL